MGIDGIGLTASRAGSLVGLIDLVTSDRVDRCPLSSGGPRPKALSQRRIGARVPVRGDAVPRPAGGIGHAQTFLRVCAAHAHHAESTTGRHVCASLATLATKDSLSIDQLERGRRAPETLGRGSSPRCRPRRRLRLRRTRSRRDRTRTDASGATLRSSGSTGPGSRAYGNSRSITPEALIVHLVAHSRYGGLVIARHLGQFEYSRSRNRPRGTGPGPCRL